MNSDRYRRANELRESGREEEALREFEAMAEVEADEQERDSLIGNQVNCLWRLGRLREARERNSKRLTGTPSSELLDAYITVSEGNLTEAEQKLKDFLTRHAELRNSEHRFLYFSAQDELGRLYFDLERYDEAITPLHEALAIADENRRRWLNYHLGVCYVWTAKWETALAKLAESLPSDPHDPWWAEAQYYIGLCHARLGKLELAERELTQSLPADRSASRWVLAQYELGCLYFRRGAYRKAKETLSMCEFFVEDGELRDKIKKGIVACSTKLGENSLTS
jgi:tetratricopeptide (TPR) repeat protein